MTTYLRDLIDIPERVFKGDYVLRLSEGVTSQNARSTLETYVVTPQIADAFDAALTLIHSSLEASSSKAAYLHGSFGSGKSHFMAVLHLLLGHDADARAVPELAEVVNKHADWLDNRRFLLPTYHLIGARSLEAAVLGGYVEQVSRLHPDAPIPAVYATGAVLGTVGRFRSDLGDEAFFAKLNERTGGSTTEGWGDLAGWDSDSYATAAAAPATAADHQRLVSDLLTAYLPEHRGLAQAGHAYVDLDAGLAIMSQHARDLGYDAVVLFLDELVLWLMTRLGDHAFVSEEATKVSKLVEAASAERPIPLISFVARQRDLRELVGQDIPGAEQLSLLDALNWWEGRFATIALEDRNLPAIAERRVLRPHDADAKGQIDEAFQRVVEQMRTDVDTALGASHDLASFRQTYPFTPAFIDTLVAASSALQRERTALKVMADVLAHRRSDLTIDEVIPVGDLYDALDASDEPFSADMGQRFAAARDLYERKLRPLELTTHDVREDEAADNTAFRADDRIIKTLLLAALIPDVDSLRALDARRLVALNFGQVKGLFSGQEASTIVHKLRTWSAQVGELKVEGDPANPTIAVQLTGIDVDAILDRARHFDTDGERRRLARELLLGEFNIDTGGALDTFVIRHTFTWRGSRRKVEIAFDNVRDTERLPDAALRPDGDDPKVVIDLPFDDAGHGPRDDQARVQAYRSANPPTGTLCWLPNFLSRDLQHDLGTLVIVEALLTGDRLSQYTEHLAVNDRPLARQTLDNQRSALRQRIRVALNQAYAATTPQPAAIDLVLDPSEQFQSLDPAFQPRPPAGPTLERALSDLCEQLLAHRFPAHPLFDTDVRDSGLRVILEECLRAVDAEADNHRVEIDQPRRKAMRSIAQPLQLGTQYEVAFVLNDHWRAHVDQRHAASGGAPLTVAAMRSYLDEPEPMGVDAHVQDVVILIVAAQMRRSFWLHDAPYPDANIGRLPDQCELREQRLPSTEDWEKIEARASVVFGIPTSRLRSAGEVARVGAALAEKASSLREAAADLTTALNDRLAANGIPRESSERYSAAASGSDLLRAISTSAPAEAVEALADAELDPTAEAVATTLAHAGRVAALISRDTWPPVLDTLATLADAGDSEAQTLVNEVRLMLQHHELSQPLEPRLRELERRATDLLATRATTPGGQPPPRDKPKIQPRQGYTRIDADRAEHLDQEHANAELERIRSVLGQNESYRLTLEWQVEQEEDSA